jgi:hypothetical protein
MDTAARTQEQFVFHLTGRGYGAELEPIDRPSLRPALLAGLRDLPGRRYDFPVVLVDGGAGEGSVRSLSGLVDELLREIAPRGIDGERLRRQVLGLERRIRSTVAEGAAGRLSTLWSGAIAASAADPESRTVLEKAGEALSVDGELLDCDEAMPDRLARHVWATVEAAKAGRFHARAGGLAVKLSDILRAAYVHSEAGRRAESLRASVGGPHQDIFDFTAMSRLLPKIAPVEELPAARRARIEWALSVLRSQRFFAPRGGWPSPDANGLHFAFEDCASALAAFRERRAEMAELVKATAIAELEADGRYDEATHDPVFAAFDATSLGPADLAGFPGYLVSIPPGATDAPGNAMLMDLLASGLPMKVVAQTDEILAASPGGDGHLVFGARGAQLASAALGLDDAFVLQSSSSDLFAVRARIHAGMAYPGPALFSIFSAQSRSAGPLPAYLVAAAAMESRAFPSFSCDPAAGSDWASRFTMADNPEPSEDWSAGDFAYADEALQRVGERLAFTLVDFAAVDPRYAAYFARVPRTGWNADMVPVDTWLALAGGERESKVPYVLVVDDADVLHRLVVDVRMMEAAVRCRERWRRLQELGGIHDSHAERLLARERAAWEGRLAGLAAAGGDGRGAPAPAEAAGALPVGGSAAGSTAVTEIQVPPSPAEAAGDAPDTAPVERPPDEPYIETIRCSSCNECTIINDRMFAYNPNKQAYIADVRAGTFRELVEAAENCQLSIIHPGKPRDPNEAGLEDLLRRAAPFA